MAEKRTSPSSLGEKSELVFTKRNYQLLIASIAIVVVGFLLMIGDTNIYDLRKTLISPMVVLTGFGLGVYAILKK